MASRGGFHYHVPVRAVVAVLAIASIGIVGCGRDVPQPSQHLQPQKRTQRRPHLQPFIRPPSLVEQEEYTGPPIVKVGETRRFGQAEVMVESVEMSDDVEAVSSRGKKRVVSGPMLAIRFTVKNVSEQQTLCPEPFLVTATDDYRNKLSVPVRDGERYAHVDSQSSVELHHGESMSVVVCIVPKVDDATQYEWRICHRQRNQGPEEFTTWGVRVKVDELVDLAGQCPE